MLTLLWLVGQMVGGSIAPVVDALSGHGAEVVVHVEDASDTHCPPAHSEMGCLVAAANAAPSVVDATTLTEASRWRVIVARPEWWDEAPPVGAVRSLPPGRGPPLA